MTREKTRPIMSQDVINSGSYSSIQGYLNEQEFIEAMNRNLAKYASFGFAGAIALALLESFSHTYTGPYAPILVALVGTLVGFIKSRRAGKEMLNEGKPILFSGDDENG